MQQKSKYLQVALDAVKAAEQIITSYYRTEMNVTVKTDKTPVTIADQKAEEVIKNIISRSFPHHSFLGEESGTHNKDAEYLWVIDPIDGTKNYTRRIPLFATQLALMHKDEIILGVSNAPEIHELMFAEKNSGAFLNDQPIKVSNTQNISSSYLSFGGIGSFNHNQRLHQLLKLEHDTQGHRGFGDFWSYHLLASGKIDIMVEATTKLWDIAAVSCIVQEAGGSVSQIDGSPLTRNMTSIIATNKVLHTEVLNYFKTSKENSMH